MKKFVLTILTIFFAYFCAYQTSGASEKQDLFGFGNSITLYKLKCMLNGETDTTNINQLYYRAETRFNYEQYNDALLDLRKVLSLDSTNLPAAILMARSYLGLQDTASAIDVLIQTVGISPEPIDGFMELGNIFKNKHFPDSSFYYYKKAFETSNQNGPANFEIANYYFQSSSFAEALNYINRAIEADDYNLEYRNLRRKIYIKNNNPDLASQEYQIILNQNSEFFGNYKEKAEKEKENGNYQASIEYYKMAILEQGNSRELLEAKAWAYHSLLQYDSAQTDFELVCQLYPDYQSYFNLAYTLDLLDNISESIKYYTKSINLNNNYSTYNNRGYENYRLKKFKESESDYTKSIELKEDYHLSYYNRGILYYETKRYEKAIDDYKKALKYTNNIGDITYSLALAYDKFKQKGNAVLTYNEFIKLAEEADSARINYASERIAFLSK